jgi:4-amino-4-deoxy-L-arabinose transferase-like glycosyltransferase
MKDTSPRLADWTLLSLVVFIVAYFFFTHEGLYDYDDYHYARLAHELASGTFQVNPDARHLLAEPFRERLLVFAPVALLYRLFGVGIYTTTLWPLLCTLGTLAICWALYRRRAPLVATGAMVLLGLHYFMLTLSNYLYPDNILMFAALASAAALLWGRRPEQGHPALWGAGFATLTLTAFLAKETIVFYLPFYLSLLVVDLLRRQHQRFWLGAVSMGLVLLIGYLSFYYAHTGDALCRLHRIEQANAYFQPKNYLGSQRGQLLARLTWQPVASFIAAGVGVALLLALAAAFSPARLHPEARFWLWLALSSMACFWWGSTSLAHYNPITLTPRMMTPLLPPLCLAAGFGLREALRNYRAAGWLALGLLLCALWLHNSSAVIYAGTGFCFAGLFLLDWSGRVSGWLLSHLPALFIVALATVLAIRPLYFMA